MPYIRLRTNKTINAETLSNLQKDFGQAISLFPGKSERWLMTDCEGDCNLSLAGKNNIPLAMVEVELFGRADSASYDSVTSEITRILTTELGIPGEGIYVKYEEISHWGWAGNNF